MYLPEVGNILYPKKYKKTDPNGKSTFFQSVSPKNWFSRNRSFFSSLGMYQVYIYIHPNRSWLNLSSDYPHDWLSYQKIRVFGYLEMRVH
jgi:hypothetical protein